MTLKHDAGYMEFLDPGADGPLLKVGTVQCVHCLDGDTKVITDRGVLDIRDVRQGDLVVDASGQLSAVNKTFSRRVSDALLVSTRGGGESTIASGEHPFLAMQASHDRCNFLVDSEPDWKPASELRKGMWLATQGATWNTSVGEFHGHEIDEELARFIGLYLAEGWVFRDGIEFGFHRDETEHIQFVTDVVKHRWGKVARYRENPGTNSARLKICSSRLEESCLAFGKGAADKKMPTEMLAYPSHIQSAMMHGLLDGDGTYNRRRPRRELKTISPHLAYQAYSTLKRLGYSPSVTSSQAYKSKKGVNHRKCYTVAFSIQSPSRKRFVRRSFDYGGHEWVKIRGITELPGDREVFNLSVASETFVANGIVTHNCGGHFPEPRMGNSDADRATRLGPGYQRGFCTNCGGFICGPDCAKCIPTELYLENIEKGRPDDFRPIVSKPLDLSGSLAGDIWGGE